MAEVEPQELTVDGGYKNAKIEIGGTVVATQDIIESITITYGCTDGNAPSFGSTYSPHCEVTINSNEIVGDANLDLIKLGALFQVKVEGLNSENYSTMGSFYIEQPPEYTDDYQITFSGEGMLGSVLAKTNVDYSLMESYSAKGYLTMEQAKLVIENQFGITVRWNTDYIPTDLLTDGKIVVPLNRKWKEKGYPSTMAYKKRFQKKLKARKWLAGMAIMMGYNVIEYLDMIVLRPLNPSSDPTDYFTADSYSADYTMQKHTYAPKSMFLTTRETRLGKKQGTVKGVLKINEDCDCNDVFANAGEAYADNTYDVNVVCPWIGRSFEAFYFTGDVESTSSGDFEDAIPIKNYRTLSFLYTPCSFDFSGWHSDFVPGTFIKVRVNTKNTETQTETTEDVLAYIMEMTFNWHGTVDVQISASYNGELRYKPPTRSRSVLRSTNTTNTENIVEVQIDDPVDNVLDGFNQDAIDSDSVDGIDTTPKDIGDLYNELQKYQNYVTPVDFRYSIACASNDKIYVLGGGNRNTPSASPLRRRFYTFDGKNWNQLSDLPFDVWRDGNYYDYNGAVIYGAINNVLSIYLDYGSAMTRFELIDSEWIQKARQSYVSTGYPESVIKYNDNTVYIKTSNREWWINKKESAGGYEYETLGKINVTIPTSGMGYFLLLNNELYAIQDDILYMCSFTQNSWINISTMPHNIGKLGCAVVYNNKIHILGGGDTSSTRKKHYEWNGSTWDELPDIPDELSCGCAVVFKNEIHIIGTLHNGVYTGHLRWNGTEWKNGYIDYA